MASKNQTSTKTSKTNSKIQCPNCNSKNIVKKGIRRNKLQSFQQYQCKQCKYIFIQNPSKYKTYTITTILNSISNYNLGNTLNQVKQKLKTQATLPTISNWINQYKNICTFHRLRKQSKKLYKPQHLIFKKTLQHNQIYKYQLHKAKLYLLFHSRFYNNQFTNISKFYEPIKQYLEKIPTGSFPHHIFQQKQPNQLGLERSSQLKFPHLNINHIAKTNLANKLTQLALNLANNNKQRHQAVQDFMLINDSTTIAAEIPVYLTNDDITYFISRGFTFNFKNYQTPITGHIDILQIRNNLIHILDYKPEANKQNPINQLTIYALGLASRTKLPLNLFKCAWFDQNNYYEFFPLHVVYPKR